MSRHIPLKTQLRLADATAQALRHQLLTATRDERNRCIDIVKREVDDCTHPECVADRRRYGFTDCAGGHIARRVVMAINGIPRCGDKRRRKKNE